jgi:transmembrane sensor
MNKEENKSASRHYLYDTYTKEEANNAIKSLSEEEDTSLFDEMSQEVWEDSSKCELDDAEYLLYKQEAIQKLNPKNKRKDMYRRILIYTGSIAAVLVLAFGVSIYIHFQNQPENIVAQAVSYIRATTSFGERKTITLPDGSQVTLNACSSIEYPSRFRGGRRFVKLSGEGFFKVFHNPSLPFVVNAHRLNVTVLGTQFDVKSYEGDHFMSVGVSTGKVKVYTENAVVYLTRKERIIGNIVDGEYKKEQSVMDVAAWMGGKLQFSDTPIRQVARELERIYNCKFVFEEGVAFDDMVTGTHDNKSLEDVLASIKYVTGIGYKMLDNAQILLYKDVITKNELPMTK